MVQSRDFVGRRIAPTIALPPGQYLTDGFPVLSAGPTPHVPLEQWEFTTDDRRRVLRRWSWQSFRELPAEHIPPNIQYVTRWSKRDTTQRRQHLRIFGSRIRDESGVEKVAA